MVDRADRRIEPPGTSPPPVRIPITPFFGAHAIALSFPFPRGVFAETGFIVAPGTVTERPLRVGRARWITFHTF